MVNWHLAFSAVVNKTILPVASHGPVILWDAETKRQLRQLQGHRGPVVSAQFNKDDQRLFTGSEDGTVRAWDVESGRCLFALYSLNDGKDWLTITPSGHFDGTPAAEAQLRCRTPGREALESIEPYRHKLKVEGLMGKVLRGEPY